jgi:hypothetical protein
MVFSRKTIGSLAQVLEALSDGAVDVLFYKHFDVRVDSYGYGIGNYLQALQNAQDDQLKALVAELFRETSIVRNSARYDRDFEAAWRELERWLLHDGWTPESGELVRLAPAAEEVTGLRDRFLQELVASGLDHDGAITKCIDDAAKAFVAEPPDFNNSITKVRIALETTARRSATLLAGAGRGTYGSDSWGKALEFLRAVGVLEADEEQVLARVYTFISDGAHVPAGVTYEEWARLARTFGLGSTYFVFKKHQAAI